MIQKKIYIISICLIVLSQFLNIVDNKSGRGGIFLSRGTDTTVGLFYACTFELLFLMGFCAVVWKCIEFLGECCREFNAECAQRTRTLTYAVAAGVPSVTAVQPSTPRDQSLQSESSADLSPSYEKLPPSYKDAMGMRYSTTV